MEKELIINSSQEAVNIAYLEDNRLMELHTQESNSTYDVGDIYLGRIKRLLPGLNAAFVDIGHSKDAFIHYTDLGPKAKLIQEFTLNGLKKKYSNGQLKHYDLKKEINKNGKINQVLSKKMEMVFQILKEPISTKGPRLTAEVTLPGRLLVLVPFSNIISISKKIVNEDERNRLEKLLESIKPQNFGLIARTAAKEKSVVPLHEEIQELVGRWETIYANLHNAKAPKKLLEEENKTQALIRDVLDERFEKITVDDKKLYQRIDHYLKENIPEKKKIVNLYSGSKPIFDQYGINRQIKSSFGKTFTMSSGAYLVIEHTEAMHVIDVNSGPKISKNKKDDVILSVNLEAAKELARQFRLRDIGGLIIIDFIDMKNRDHRTELFKSMKEYMKDDRAQHTILPLSKFGLMQITRQRVKPEIVINTSEQCYACGGTGKVNSTLVITDDIERDLEKILETKPKAKLKLVVHPFVRAFILKGFPNLKWRWFRKYKSLITIEESSDFGINKYKFYDKNGDEVRF